MLDLLKKQNEEIALLSEEENINYKDLRKKVINLSSKFKTGSVNIIICTNTVDSIIIYLSLLYIGAIPLLLSNELDTKSINFYKQRYNAKTVVAINNNKFKFSNKSWYFNKHTIFEFENFNLIKNQELALLLTTSGSTGNPKVVRISKKNLICNTKSICKYLSLKKEDRHITTLPMNYTYGLSCINTFLYAGGSIVLNKYSLLERGFWALLEKYSPTSFSGVPFTYEILYKVGFEKLLNSSIKVFTQAGGKLEKKILTKIAKLCESYNLLFYVMYGQTEATARMSYLPPEKLLEKIDSIGIAIPGGKFEIDYDLKNSIYLKQENKFGELIYKGENVAMGYAEKFSDLDNNNEFNKILSTGDLAYMDDEKYIYIIGRKNRFAKISGVRVSLDDIEEILKEYNCVSAVISNDKTLNIFIESHSIDINLKKIKENLIKRTTLSPISFKLNFIDMLPRNDNGKIDYQQLRKNGIN